MIANARMYSVDAATAAQWRVLLEWAVARANVAIDVIEYPSPQPLPALWSRSDVACALMCGYPLMRAAPRPTIVAAMVPSPPRYEHAPIYWTDLVVRADSPWHTPHDVIGKRVAFTTKDSQSGYHAPRRFFAPYAGARRCSSLFAAVVGPLITPANVARAVVAGDADVGPLDSYAHDLLCLHDPALTAHLRMIARTPPTPIPPFVAAPGIPDHVISALRSALLEVAHVPELADVRAALLLEGFISVDIQRYDALATQAREADALGYPRLA